MLNDRDAVYFPFTNIVDLQRVCGVEWIANTVFLFL
jgi:hypothetical protein